MKRSGQYITQLYHNRPQTLNLDRAKASLLNDRKSVHISNIDRLAIAQQRELSRGPKSKFETDCGISGYKAFIPSPLPPNPPLNMDESMNQSY